MTRLPIGTLLAIVAGCGSPVDRPTHPGKAIMAEPSGHGIASCRQVTHSTQPVTIRHIADAKDEWRSNVANDGGHVAFVSNGIKLYKDGAVHKVIPLGYNRVVNAFELDGEVVSFDGIVNYERHYYRVEDGALVQAEPPPPPAYRIEGEDLVWAKSGAASPVKLASFGTEMDGGGNYTYFWSIAPVDGGAVFVSGPEPRHRAILYARGGGIEPIIDMDSKIESPEFGRLDYLSSELSVDGTRIAFTAATDRESRIDGALFVLSGCTLQRIVAVGDMVDGRRVTNVFDIGPNSLSAGSIAFSMQTEKPAEGAEAKAKIKAKVNAKPERATGFYVATLP